MKYIFYEITQYHLAKSFLTILLWKRKLLAYGSELHMPALASGYTGMARHHVEIACIRYGVVPLQRGQSKKILTIDTPQLARKGEVWGVFCEYKSWFIVYISHFRTV